jgi:hypothetical protein
VARSEPSDQELSSYAAAIATSIADVADISAPGAFGVEGPGQMDDRCGFCRYCVVYSFIAKSPSNDGELE